LTPYAWCRVLDQDPYHHACLPLHVACQVELKDTNGLFYLAHKLVDVHPKQAVRLIICVLPSDPSSCQSSYEIFMYNALLWLPDWWYLQASTHSFTRAHLPCRMSSWPGLLLARTISLSARTMKHDATMARPHSWMST
jgi:hypothetical protein